jgi:hypothetical protein
MTIDDDLPAWTAGLDDLFALVVGRFFQVAPRLRARAYVRGLLAQTLGEAAGDATPDGMQRLLNRAAWDTDGSAMTCAPTSPGTSDRPKSAKFFQELGLRAGVRYRPQLWSAPQRRRALPLSPRFPRTGSPGCSSCSGCPTPAGSPRSRGGGRHPVHGHPPRDQGDDRP